MNGHDPAGDEPLVAVGTTLGFRVVDEVAVNEGPIGGIAVSPDGSRLVVTNYGGHRVSVIDMGTNAVVATHPVALRVSDLAVSPDGRQVYASRTGAGKVDVAVIDRPMDQIDAIAIAAPPGTVTQCLRVSADGQRLYVATHGPSGGELVMIDPCGRRVTDIVEIGSPIRDVALSRDGVTVYVASCSADFGAVVDVIDADTNVVTRTAKIGEIGGFLTQLALSGNGDRAYLVHDSVTVLCTLTHDVVCAITVGQQPSCVVESPDGQYLYIADYSGAVSVVSIASTTSPVIRAIDDEIVVPPQQRRPPTAMT